MTQLISGVRKACAVAVIGPGPSPDAEIAFPKNTSGISRPASWFPRDHVGCCVSERARFATEQAANYLGETTGTPVQSLGTHIEREARRGSKPCPTEKRKATAAWHG